MELYLLYYLFIEINFLFILLAFLHDETIFIAILQHLNLFPSTGIAIFRKRRSLHFNDGGRFQKENFEGA